MRVCIYNDISHITFNWSNGHSMSRHRKRNNYFGISNFKKKKVLRSYYTYFYKIEIKRSLGDWCCILYIYKSHVNCNLYIARPAFSQKKKEIVIFTTSKLKGFFSYSTIITDPLFSLLWAVKPLLLLPFANDNENTFFHYLPSLKSELGIRPKKYSSWQVFFEKKMPSFCSTICQTKADIFFSVLIQKLCEKATDSN